VLRWQHQNKERSKKTKQGKQKVKQTERKMCYTLLIYDCGHTKKQYEPYTPIYRMKQEKKEIPLPGVPKIQKKKFEKRKSGKIELEILNEKIPVVHDKSLNKPQQFEGKQQQQDEEQQERYYDCVQHMKMTNDVTCAGDVSSSGCSDDDENALCQCWGRTGEQIVLENCGKEECKPVEEKEVEEFELEATLKLVVESETPVEVEQKEQAQDVDSMKMVRASLRTKMKVFIVTNV